VRCVAGGWSVDGVSDVRKLEEGLLDMLVSSVFLEEGEGSFGSHLREQASRFVRFSCADQSRSDFQGVQ
jgi:hypothetical protein